MEGSTKTYLIELSNDKQTLEFPKSYFADAKKMSADFEEKLANYSAHGHFFNPPGFTFRNGQLV